MDYEIFLTTKYYKHELIRTSTFLSNFQSINSLLKCISRCSHVGNKNLYVTEIAN